MKKPPVGLHLPLRIAGILVAGGFFIAVPQAHANVISSQTDFTAQQSTVFTNGTQGSTRTFGILLPSLSSTFGAVRVRIGSEPPATGGDPYPKVKFTLGDFTTSATCEASFASQYRLSSTAEFAEWDFSSTTENTGTLCGTTLNPAHSLYLRVDLQYTRNDNSVGYSYGDALSPATWYDPNNTSGSHYPDIGTFYYVLSDDGTLPPLDSTTRIDSVVPVDGGTIATSSAATVGANGFINQADFDAGSTTVKISVYNNAGIPSNSLVGPLASGAGAALCNSLPTWLCPHATALQTPISTRTIRFPVASSGSFSYSTSTPIIPAGVYTMKTTIEQPSFTLLGFSIGTRTLVATTTTFIASTTSAYDVFQGVVNEQTANAVNNFASSTCNIVSGNFDLGACALSFVVPGPGAFDAYTQLPATAQTKFPFSYVSSIAGTWSGLTASSTDNAPAYSFSLHQLGIGSTSPIGNILPDVVVLSTTTVKQYYPAGVFDLLKALAGAALVLGLFFDIFFTTRNMIRT